MRVAVVGHVEWIEFAAVERLPHAGEIVHARESWEVPGGGGGVAAVPLARLAGECLLITALADDELGRRSKRELEALGVRVEVAWRQGPQRRAFVHVDGGGERTITVIGERSGAHGADSLPWHELGGADAVYMTAGDADAVRAARRARTLVATARAKETLAEAAVELDALVSSSGDAGEQYTAGSIAPEPRLVARTAGSSGGTALTAEGAEIIWQPEPPPGPVLDTYGAGDCFAAGLTFGLASGPVEEALRLGARCGADCVTRRGPYERPPAHS
ncbi:MAG: PfkB family carbohydrate kinase [Solirubrobacterales bacterium]